MFQDRDTELFPCYFFPFKAGVQAFHPGYVDEYVYRTNLSHNLTKLPSIAIPIVLANHTIKNR